MSTPSDDPSREQAIYARWIGAGVAVGFVALVASFIAYVSGLVPPGIPPETLPRYWSLPLAEYVRATGAPTGWSWIRRLGEGDLLNFAGVAILGASTIVAYLRMLPEFCAKRRYLYLAIGVAEVAVLVAAASGRVFTNH